MKEPQRPREREQESIARRKNPHEQEADTRENQ